MTTRELARPGRVAPASSGSVWLIAVAAFLLLATEQRYTVPFTGLGQSPAQLLLTVLAALWVITRLVGQRDLGWAGLLSALVCAGLAVDLLSYGLAAGRGLGADAGTASNQALLAEVIGAVVVFAVVSVVRSVRDLLLVQRALVLGAGLSGLFALVQYATGVDVADALRLPGLRETGSALVDELQRGGLTRAQGSAAHPLALGAVMTFAVPLGVGLILHARAEGRRAWPWALVSLVCLAGGLVSLSRSVLVGLVAALLVMMWRWPVRRLVGVVVAAGAVVGAAALAGTTLVAALASLVLNGSNDYSLQSRSNGRSYVWMHFADHLWLGQGLGTYQVPVQPVLDDQYLDQLMETGLLGLLVYVGLLLVAIGYALRAAALATRAADRQLLTGLAGALAAVAVISLILDSGGFVQVATMSSLLVALAAAGSRLRPAATAGAATAR